MYCNETDDIWLYHACSTNRLSLLTVSSGYIIQHINTTGHNSTHNNLCFNTILDIFTFFLQPTLSFIFALLQLAQMVQYLMLVLDLPNDHTYLSCERLYKSPWHPTQIRRFSQHQQVSFYWYRWFEVIISTTWDIFIWSYDSYILIPECKTIRWMVM